MNKTEMEDGLRDKNEFEEDFVPFGKTATQLRN